MGLFFNRKKNKPEAANGKIKKHNDVQDVKNVYLEAPAVAPDMVSLIKQEQSADILNPFTSVEGKEANQNLCYAKRYGGKYVGVATGQLASTKVVDVRSYVKPDVKVEKTAVEKELDQIGPDPVVEKPKTGSFFDDILKSLEDEEDTAEVEPESEVEVEKKPEPAPVPQKPKPLPSVAKKPTKKKKSIDIDIISGDFGGADIL